MLASLDEVPQDGFVVTASLVGANSSPTAHLEPAHYLRAAALPATASMDASLGSSPRRTARAPR
jgi:hypothetical protein